MVQRDPKYSVRGPVLQSYGYVDKYRQHMTTLEFEVAHGTNIIPSYGFFARVERQNTNKSRAFIYIPSTNEDENPDFHSSVETVTDFNEYICKASITTTIVSKDVEVDEGDDVWESSLSELDESHNILKTIRIIDKQSVCSTEFDGVLNGDNSIVYTLTKNKPLPDDVGLNGNVFTSFQQIKCGWYVAKEETLANTFFTYCSTENYYWPPVLEQVDEPPTSPIDLGILLGDKAGIEYTAGILIDYRIKQAYNGPTRVDIEVSFQEDSVCEDIEHMNGDSINYQGIFFNLRIPESLHGVIELNETTGDDHPTLKAAQSRNKSYHATNFIDWPDSLVGSVQVRPHKGGYVKVKKTYYKPEVI